MKLRLDNLSINQSLFLDRMLVRTDSIWVEL